MKPDTPYINHYSLETCSPTRTNIRTPQFHQFQNSIPVATCNIRTNKRLISGHIKHSSRPLLCWSLFPSPRTNSPTLHRYLRSPPICIVAAAIQPSEYVYSYDYAHGSTSNTSQRSIIRSTSPILPSPLAGTLLAGRFTLAKALLNSHIVPTRHMHNTS